MSTPLRILHVEDNPDDAELLRLELDAAGYAPHYLRVETRQEMAGALADEAWDVIVSDFNLPAFNAYEALRVLRATGQDIPLIVVSGFIGELEAVALMKAGAHDYVMKSNLARLVPAIERERKDAAIRAERRQAEQALHESRRRLQDLTAFLQQVREEERTRIARELHDELGQALTALRIDVGWLQDRLDAHGDAGAKLTAMRALIDKTVDSVRRISEDLRPGMLDDLGLAAAIEHHVVRFSEQTGIACELGMSSDHYTLDDATATALFRVLQESLTNVARHAQASRVTVRLQHLPTEMLLVVKDDGRGLPEAATGGKKTYGLLGMQERVKLLGGTLDVSGSPGKGTRIEVSLPLAAPAAPSGESS